MELINLCQLALRLSISMSELLVAFIKACVMKWWVVVVTLRRRCCVKLSRVPLGRLLLPSYLSSPFCRRRVWWHKEADACRLRARSRPRFKSPWHCALTVATSHLLLLPMLMILLLLMFLLFDLCVTACEIL
jgi:hypothetical protein